MADLTITAASVVPVTTSKSVRKEGIAGGTITAGMPVYKDSSNEIQPAANTSAVLANVVGIALNGASDGQPVTYQDSGVINLGATLVVGMPYFLSAAGKISPATDVATGDFVTYLGTALTAANFEISIHASGTAAASNVDAA